MTRLSKILLAAAFVAAPLTASANTADPPADGSAPAEPDPNAGGGGDGTGGAATGDGSATPATPDAGAMMTGWSRSQIDRPLVLQKGKLGAGADLVIAHASITILGVTASSTSELLAVQAGYGVTDKITAGGSYTFALNEFEIKGTLDPYASISLVHNDKLDVGASVDLALDLNDPDPASTTGETRVGMTLQAGLGVRYKVTPKIAVFTGSPWTPGPLGQHLKIGLNEGAAKTFDIPVGAGFQATPELFAYLTTNLATILLSDPGSGSRVSSIADVTPITLGGWYSVNKNIDAGATFTFPDVQNAGDFYLISVGARYYN